MTALNCVRILRRRARDVICQNNRRARTISERASNIVRTLVHFIYLTIYSNVRWRLVMLWLQWDGGWWMNRDGWIGNGKWEMRNGDGDEDVNM